MERHEIYRVIQPGREDRSPLAELSQFVARQRVGVRNGDEVVGSDHVHHLEDMASLRVTVI